MDNAYMMRRDGTLIPVTQHPYGSDTNVEETIAVGEWLYKNSSNPEAKVLLIDILAAYAKALDPDISFTEAAQTIKYVFSRYKYHVMDLSFIDAHWDEINSAARKKRDESRLMGLNDKINKMLNEEFLRIRIGGEVNSAAGNNEAYFRVSSTGFNWFNNIWEFVERNKSRISAVTIMKDFESTGYSDYYYRHGGKTMYHLPTDEFLTLSGTPVTDSKKMKWTHKEKSRS